MEHSIVVCFIKMKRKKVVQYQPDSQFHQRNYQKKKTVPPKEKKKETKADSPLCIFLHIN